MREVIILIGVLVLAGVVGWLVQRYAPARPRARIAVRMTTSAAIAVTSFVVFQKGLEAAYMEATRERPTAAPDFPQAASPFPGTMAPTGSGDPGAAVPGEPLVLAEENRPKFAVFAAGTSSDGSGELRPVLSVDRMSPPKTFSTEEFVIGIVLGQVAQDSAIRAVLVAPESWKIRSLDDCGAEVKVSGAELCTRSANRRAELRWDISAKDPGRYKFTVQVRNWPELPSSWVAHLGSDAQFSRLNLTADGQLLDVVSRSTAEPIASDSRPDAGGFNLSTGRWSEDLLVVRPLGVDERTWALLAVIGVVGGALLSSGVVAAVIGARTARAKP